MTATPGARTPGERPRTEESVEAVGVDASATGTTDLGSVVADEAEVQEVTVASADQDFDFNVTMEGADVFSAEQSLSTASETFTPDQNARVGGSETVEFTFDVSSASANGSATADVSIRVAHRHE